MENILVSIVIPVYNGANYLAEAIDSALAQTYKNIEIIVVNDGSNDNGATERVALSYGDKIRYISKENGGVSSALNLGIREMKGDYFSWLSHDDIYRPEKIATQVKLIKTEKDIVLCSGSLMTEDGTPIRYYTKTLDKVFNGRELFSEFMHHYALNGLGFLIPKEAFEKAGYFDESLRYLQDLDMWIRIMWYDYRFVCHSDLLVVTRIHKNQVTNTGSHLFVKDRQTMIDKHLSLLKKTEVCQRDLLIKLYFLLAVGENCKSIAEMRPYMENVEGYHLLRIKGCLYRLKNRMKELLRKCRDILYKIKKMRD